MPLCAANWTNGTVARFDGDNIGTDGTYSRLDPFLFKTRTDAEKARNNEVRTALPTAV